MRDRPDLDAIAERAEAATDGPWGVEPVGDSLMVMHRGHYTVVAILGDPSDPQAQPDAEFLAAAREDVPALLGEVRRLTAELASARREERARIAEMRAAKEADLRELADRKLAAARREERERCAAALNHHVQAHRARGDHYAAEIAGRAQAALRALPDEDTPAATEETP